MRSTRSSSWTTAGSPSAVRTGSWRAQQAHTSRCGNCSRSDLPRSAHRRQVLHLLLGEVEPDPVVDPSHGTDRDGDFLAPPNMPLLEQNVGHLVVARIDHEAMHLSDGAVEGTDMIAVTQVCLTQRDRVVDDDR